MATDVGAGSKHTPTDREYLDSLSACLLMEFWNYVFSPTYIALNVARFLDHEWVDMGVLSTDNCNAIIPSNFDTPAVDPLDNFFTSYGFTASSTDLGTIINPGFASAGPSDLPTFPLPLPESPPAASPAVGQSSEPGPSAPRSRRSRQEVDIGNILHMTRPRAPSKRFAEHEDVSGRPQKKARASDARLKR
ncbi:hypothetical protein DFH09DRAFT_1431702 [Mycena vulgaris]|nr:hypothetical protein DFH09DRAFT_1431702 [Mycena vulgaris]